jgi:cytochrome c oxidase assembly protein subunit 15
VNATLPAAAAARLRGLEVSHERFRRLAITSAVMLLVIVATGATVRLTASGLGCEHWPGCQPGDPFPRKGYHSYVEFSNRVVAFLTIVATLAAWVGSLLSPGVGRRVRWLAGGVFAGTLAQAPLGAITVYFDLNPWLVITHLLLSLVVLAGGVLVALSTYPSPRPAVPAWVRRGSLVPLVALAALVVTGTIVTGSGPHPGGVDVRRLGAFADAIWLHVRATAVFGLTFLVLLGWAWRRRDRFGWVLRGALVLLGLLLAQMAVGEIQYRTKLPWWLVLVHVTMAGAVWGTAVALVASLWRSRTASSSPA